MNSWSEGTWICFSTCSPQIPSRSGGAPSLHVSSTHTSVCSLLRGLFLRLLFTKLFQSPLRKGKALLCRDGWWVREAPPASFKPLCPQPPSLIGSREVEGGTRERVVSGVSRWLRAKSPSHSLNGRGGRGGFLYFFNASSHSTQLSPPFLGWKDVKTSWRQIQKIPNPAEGSVRLPPAASAQEGSDPSPRPDGAREPPPTAHGRGCGDCAGGYEGGKLKPGSPASRWSLAEGLCP